MSAILHCACAARPALLPVALHDGLPARRCRVCAGLLLSLDDYRRWRERRGGRPVDAAAAGPDLPRPAEPQGARPCPACGRPMSRHRVGLAPDFRLDRCGPCQLLWLDGGEWQALHAAGLIERIDAILADAWQRRLQAEDNRLRRRDALRARLGADVFDEVRRLQCWLAAQPNRAELLALINGEPL